MKRLFFILLIFMPLALPAQLWVRNGNYTFPFTDASKGHGLDIKRKYNTQVLGKGMFGYGWGSTFEAKVSSVGGVIIMVEEVPGGGKSYYVLNKKKSYVPIIEKIVKKAELEGQSPSYYKKLKTKLLKDIALLVAFGERYKLFEKPPVGSVFECVDRNDEFIKVLSGGYLRKRNDGIRDEFDNEGKLMRLTYKNGDFLRFRYDRRDKLVEVRDNTGRSMKFDYNKDYLVEKILFFDGTSAVYKYDDRENLIASTDTDNNTYTYKYNDYHNITEVVSKPKESGQEPEIWTLKHDTEANKVTYVKEPDGWETFVEYGEDATANTYYESIDVVKRFGRQVVSEKYEYWKRPKPDGSTYIYKYREKKGKNDRTVINTMCCGTPLIISENGNVTRFQYDKKGRLKKKVFPDGRIISIKYDEKGRFSYIYNDGNPHRIKYDNRNNIVFIGNKYIKFKIYHDDKDKVVKLKNNKNQTLFFKYDNKDRLIKYGNSKGYIEMHYEADGRVRLVPKGDAQDEMWSVRQVYQDYNDLMSVLELVSIKG